MVQRWPPWEVTSLEAQLQSLVDVVESMTGEELREARDLLSRLLVVRACGYLEQSVVEVARAYVDHRAGGPVRSFSRSWMERSRNPTPEALEEFVGRFDAVYAEELTTLLDDQDQRLRRELHFMVDRRNRIAHGLNEGLGHRRSLALVTVSTEIADWFILRFRPDR
jgi:hypothetical protein